MKYTSVLRAHCGHAGAKFPVIVTAGNSAPFIAGEYGNWTTRGGTPVRYPSAYAKVGWSNLVYTCSTIDLRVGFEWLRANMPSVAIDYARSRGIVTRHKIRVYQQTPRELRRKITEVTKLEV